MIFKGWSESTTRKLTGCSKSVVCAKVVSVGTLNLWNGRLRWLKRRPQLWNGLTRQICNRLLKLLVKKPNFMGWVLSWAAGRLEFVSHERPLPHPRLCLHGAEFGNSCKFPTECLKKTLVKWFWTVVSPRLRSLIFSNGGKARVGQWEPLEKMKRRVCAFSLAISPLWLAVILAASTDAFIVAFLLKGGLLCPMVCLSDKPNLCLLSLWPKVRVLLVKPSNTNPTKWTFNPKPPTINPVVVLLSRWISAA